MLGYTHPHPVHAGIWSTSGRYASHWNAFLFNDFFSFDLNNKEVISVPLPYPWRSVNKLLLTFQDAIYRIKEHFNKEFDSVYERKEQEIAKIKDKNKRIRKIVEDLEVDIEIYEPELGVIEKPENLLFVDDHEVSS